ncbi:MAG: FAD:protein FMN transferase [Anaerolineales bacterium]|nr:FAD:protein FMN transferase [Anaerolineales bacterium]
MQQRLSFRAMGCNMLAILEKDFESAPTALTDVPGWFEDWEQSFSRFRPASELSLLNRTFDQPIHVSDAFWDVFQTAMWADEFTEGLVTPTVLDAMLEAGYNQPFESMQKYQINSILQTSLEIPPLSMVIADHSAQTINLPRGVRLDFGGVAKGWCAHQAVERLKEQGPCLVNAGGDIAISGSQSNGEPWLIGISNPFKEESDLEVIHVHRCGIASSGKDRRHWNRNGVFQHHIIHPQTGSPAETDLLRVTVIAPTVMEAEAAAKTVFILGSQNGLEWIEDHSDLAAVLILESGEIIHSQRMQSYL